MPVIRPGKGLLFKGGSLSMLHLKCKYIWLSWQQTRMARNELAPDDEDVIACHAMRIANYDGKKSK